MHHGSCLCGKIRFSVAGDLTPPTACHCTKCRKHTGHYEVSTDVPRDAVTIIGEDELRWYGSSERVRRGFCGTCGSTLFFDALGQDWVGISMGAFDGPTHTRIALHIFVADKGDYYALSDGVPQNMQ